MAEGNHNELNRTAKVTYGSGEFFNSTSTVIILMLYLKFLTDVVGLSPFWAGLCVVSGKLWDAISDPLIGHLSDRTRSRWGRRRIYFLVFSIPGSLSFLSMWLVFDFDSVWGTMTYYALAYVTFKTLASLLNVPYQALGPELASGYDERTSLIVYRMAFALGGAIAAGVIPNVIVNRFVEGGHPEQGHLAVSALFGLCYAAIWLWIFATIRERPAATKHRSNPLTKALALTLKNRSFRILITMYLCAFIALDILTAATKYFIDEYIRRPSLMPVIMGSMLGCALLALPLYFVIIRRFDRKTSYIVGAVIWSLSLIGLFMLGPGTSNVVIVAVMVCVGVGVAAAFVVPWSALPEVIDVDIARNGRSEEGLYAGIMTFLRKATTTLAIFGIATSLEVFGYRSPEQLEGAPQAESALWSIRVFSTLIPAMIIVVSIAVALRYPITKDAHRLMRRKLEAPEALSSSEERDLGTFLDRAYGK